MKKRFYFFPSIFVVCLLFLAVPAQAFLFWDFPWENKQKKDASTGVSEKRASQPLTLLEAYRLTLKKSESVAITAEEINQARARFYRSFDYFLPSVHFVMENTYQDGTSNSSSFSNSNAGRRSTPENKFTFTQPIFSGFKEVAALQGSGADKKQQAMAWRRAKELLFVDVMSAYYAVLEAERNVRTLASTRRLGAKRARELEHKIKVGRLRGTDKQTTLSDLKLIHADLIQARSTLEVSRNLFEYYIGESLGERVLVDEEVPAEIFDASESISKSKSRADVVAAEQGYRVSEKKVISAQSDLFPTISASGNYYTRRVGFQSGNDWDVTIQMDVPIFEVGTALGDIKQAVATRQTSLLQWRQADRLAELDIRDALEDLRSVRLRERALFGAREASNKNYELISQDYSRSLVNNLDVLDALRRLQDVELRYNDAYFQMKESYWKLKAAVGEILT